MGYVFSHTHIRHTKVLTNHVYNKRSATCEYEKLTWLALIIAEWNIFHKPKSYPEPLTSNWKSNLVVELYRCILLDEYSVILWVTMFYLAKLPLLAFGVHRVSWQSLCMPDFGIWKLKSWASVYSHQKIWQTPYIWNCGL